MPETAYRDCHRWGTRLTHHYGPRVHILSDPWSLTLAARLSSPEVVPPSWHHLLEAGFWRLLEAASEQLPIRQVSQATRMTGIQPEAAYVGPLLDPDAQVVIVDIARGGMIPSYVFQKSLLHVLNPDGVRVDHVYMQREVDEAGHVIGVTVAGSKIGGAVAGATVFLPDPMAATGSSMADALRTYHAIPGGSARKYVCCHLMVTPEYLKRITTLFPEVEIYALRIDRGMSPPDVLESVPGARWDEERGLNDHDYIVPGAGGVGELINNADV